MNKSSMLSEKELQHCKVNYEIIDKILLESEKRLQGLIAVKSDVNQASFSLFHLYLTILTALVSAGFLSREKYVSLSWFCFLVAPFFLASVICVIMSLRGGEYGTFGTSPRLWLQKHYLEGNKDTLAVMLAYLAHDYDSRIESSYLSNKRKILVKDVGILTSLSAVPAAAIMFFLYRDRFQCISSIRLLGVEVVAVAGVVVAAYLFEKGFLVRALSWCHSNSA